VYNRSSNLINRHTRTRYGGEQKENGVTREKKKEGIRKGIHRGYGIYSRKKRVKLKNGMKEGGR